MEGTTPDPPPDRAPLRGETVLLLAGVALLLVFLALEPYLSYSIFGSDTGEYYRLTVDLVGSGRLPHGAAYAGWGSAYPDFPGLFLVAGGAAGALHLDPFTALAVTVPTLAVLSVLPLFLLFRRLYPHDTVALFGAALASVAMPRLFSIAHPAPLAIGDLLCVAALWMLVEGRHDRRWYLPLALTGGALILTHHLSSYFFAVSALGGIVLLELWRPGLWSRRFPAWEFGFLAAFVTATFAFWFYGTTTFVSKVLLPGFGGSAYVGFAAFEAAGLAVVGVAAVVVAVRRRRFRAGRPWVRLPTDRSMLRDAVLIAVGVAALASALLLVPIPGTTQTTDASALVWFSPVLAIGVLCAGSRRALTLGRLAPFALPWTGAVGLSAALALALAAVGSAEPSWGVLSGFAAALSPARAAEYLLIPIALLVAVGTARLAARAGDAGGRRAFLAAAVGASLLLAANAAIVYPPPNDLGGFQEALSRGDAALFLWVGIVTPANTTVASDHRLSSMLFGFDQLAATWVTTPALFTGSSRAAAFAELAASGVPNPATPRPIVLVAIDGTMYTGVALSPSGLASPLSPAAVAWFEARPFVPIYENGLEAVYLVAWGPA